MGRTVLVGSTGFVGGNLLASHAFDAACHSTDVAGQFGKDNDLVVYAGCRRPCIWPTRTRRPTSR